LDKIKRVIGRKVFFVSIIFSFSIVALALGGIGGSFQLSRILLLLLLPLIIIRFPLILKLNFLKYNSQIKLFALLLWSISLISVIWSIDRLVTLEYTLVLFVNLIPLLMVGLLSDIEILQIRKYIPIAWGIAATIVIPLASYEIVTGNHFMLDGHARGGGISQFVPFAAGFFGNLNNLSLFLFFCLFGISFYTTEKNDGSWLKWSLLVIWLLGLTIILLNAGRGAILSIACLAVIVFLPRVKVFNIAGLFLFGYLFYIVANDFEIIDFSMYVDYFILRFTDFGADVGNNDGRWTILVAGLDGLYSTLGFGVGAGASSEYLATIPHLLIPNAHNIFLEWALSFGLIGVFLFFWYLLRTVIAARVIINQTHRRLIFGFVLVMPIFGVVQSLLLGYTYFWLALATMSVFAMPINKFSAPFAISKKL